MVWNLFLMVSYGLLLNLAYNLDEVTIGDLGKFGCLLKQHSLEMTEMNCTEVFTENRV